MKFTLDMNAIIALKERDSNHIHLRELVNLHNTYGIEVYVCTASASEKQKGIQTPEFIAKNYSDFEAIKKSAGVGHLPEITVPVIVLGESYWGKAKFGSKEQVLLMDSIAQIMFSKDWKDLNFKDRRGWSNRRDVLTFQSHVDNGSGVLVTSDSHFLKNRDQLKKLAESYNSSNIDLLEPIDALSKAKYFISAHAPNTTCPK